MLLIVSLVRVDAVSGPSSVRVTLQVMYGPPSAAVPRFEVFLTRSFQCFSMRLLQTKVPLASMAKTVDYRRQSSAAKKEETCHNQAERACACVPSLCANVPALQQAASSAAASCCFRDLPSLAGVVVLL